MSSEDPNNKQPISSWLIPKRPSSKRSWIIVIACLATLLFHLIFIILSHYGLIRSSTPTLKKKTEVTYEIALNKPEEMNFVDTNPYLLEEEPPKTNNYAAKSQKAAQETPADTPRKDLPTIEGDMDEILKIVPDQLLPQDELIEIAEMSKSSSSLNDDSIELKEQKTDQGVKIASRPKPKPRQRVKPLVGGIRNNTSASNNLGLTAVDARFNQFGAYRQKMQEAIGYQWYLLVSNYGSPYDLCGRVVISYTINQAGDIINLEVEENSSNLLALISKDSILSLVSFGPWNEDMIKILGKEQTFCIGFNIR